MIKSQQVLEQYGREIDDFKTTSYAKFAVSLILISLYFAYAKHNELAADITLALIMLYIPIIGLLAVLSVNTVLALERAMFYLKLISLGTIVIGVLLITQQTEGFQTRVVFLYAILFTTYATDFLYIDKIRYGIFVLFGCGGVFILPGELSTQLMLVLVFVFLSVIGYDTVRVRQDNIQLAKELKQASESVIYKLAHFDNLTQLPNKVLFREMGENHQRSKSWGKHQLAILSIGIKDIKMINDSFGHQIGDRTLQEIGKRIQNHFSEYSNFISRFEGAYFNIALFNFDNPAQVESISQTFLRTFSVPIYLDQHPLILSCSIGIAYQSNTTKTFDQLVQEAETAMHEIKLQGRNQYLVYSQDMSASSKKRLIIENALRNSIQNDTNFFLVYQPQLDLKTKKICGAEALLRWHDSELGPLSPIQFIPIAEQTGLIIPIGYWVLHQALHDIRHLKKLGIQPPHISINLSSAQFEDPNLLTRLLSELAEAQIKEDHIGLELTESVVMHDPKYAIKLLQQLQQQKIKIAIDDFGVAYSSLSYLKTLPADRIKIDKSFIDEIHTSASDRAIISSIIDMGHKLGLTVLAEGVEAEEQLQLLQQLNCDQIQGYHYSKPIAFHEFATFIKNNHK